MKKLYSFLIVFLFSVVYSSAQTNLTANGSFEQYIVCPDNTSQVYKCSGWHNFLNTPDYFDTCATYPVCIPSNFCGYQFPFQGNAYTGIGTYAAAFPDYREIIGTTLLDTMKPSNIYHISMRVSRGNWTNQNYNVGATNKMGMQFTTHPYNSSNLPSINNFAQLYEDSVLTDTINWLLLSWNYVPDSAYTYLYFGNFFDDNHTDTLIFGHNIDLSAVQAYYFIDSVNVICNGCIPTEIANHLLPETSLSYNSIQENLIVHLPSGERSELFIINTIGQTLSHQTVENSSEFSVSYLSSGIYLAYLRNEEQCVVKKIIINH